MSLSKRFEEFQPSKALWFWSTAGAVVLTMVVGFTAGGWVIDGSIDLCAEKLAAMEALPEGAGMTEEATTSEPVADQS